MTLLCFYNLVLFGPVSSIQYPNPEHKDKHAVTEIESVKHTHIHTHAYTHTETETDMYTYTDKEIL